jgi:hypothetical protein
MISIIDKITYGTLIFFSIIFFGFGIYDCVKYAQRNVYKNNDYKCGEYDTNITSIIINKQLWNQWNWEYKGDSAAVVQRCPTFTHDVDVKINGRLSARTDGKVWTVVSLTHINDCHGNRLWNIKTGSVFQTIINMNTIWVALLVFDHIGNIKYYIKQELFYIGDITLMDVNGTIVGGAKRELSPLFKWTLTKYVQDFDLRILLTILGKVSFSSNINEKKYKNDICNETFLYFGIVALCSIGLVLLGIGYVIYSFVKKNNYENTDPFI